MSHRPMRMRDYALPRRRWAILRATGRHEDAALRSHKAICDCPNKGPCRLSRHGILWYTVGGSSLLDNLGRNACHSEEQ